jgi:hypothetical protein
MGGTQNIQALLRQGLLPFLAKKVGMQLPMGGQSGGQPGMPLPRPNMNPTISPGRQPQQSATSTAPAYNIKPDPRTNVGNFNQPQAQPIPEIHSLQQLITGFYTRREQSKQAEAANAAQALMQAIEGAKNTGDWTPAYEILTKNEKLFNKVYKGWLQKSEQQKKQAQAGPEKSDPETQGFEQGVQTHLQKKQQQQQPRPPVPGMGTAPTSLAGYQLPAAGPQQALQQQGMSAERQAVQQDPTRVLQGQLTGGETRQAELGKEGLAVTPKLQAELEKYDAEIKKAELTYQKGQLDLQTAQQKAITTGKRDEAMLKALDLKNQKAAIDLDIWRQKRANEIAKHKGLKNVSQSFQLKWQVIQRAENVLKNVIANKGQIDKSNISTIASLLQSAGASKLASTLSDQQKSSFRPWLFSYSSPQEILDGLNEYKEAYKKAFIDAKETTSPTDSDKETPEGSDEGDPVDADIIVSPEDLEPVKKP